jgi:hypothetical protein
MERGCPASPHINYAMIIAAPSTTFSALPGRRSRRMKRLESGRQDPKVAKVLVWSAATLSPLYVLRFLPNAEIACLRHRIVYR